MRENIVQSSVGRDVNHVTSLLRIPCHMFMKYISVDILIKIRRRRQPAYVGTRKKYLKAFELQMMHLIYYE